MSALGCRVLAIDSPGNRDVLAGYEKWETSDLGAADWLIKIERFGG